MPFPFRHWLSPLLHRLAWRHPARADGQAPSDAEALARERLRRLEAESALQRLRLDLAEARQCLSRLEAERQRQSREAAGLLQQRLEARLEEVLAPLATPLTHLLTQQHLIEREGKALRPPDLLATSRALWLALAPAGVEALEPIGAVVPWNPDRHEPLRQSSPLAAGTQVRVRIPGLLLNGRVLKKASVELWLSEG